MSTLPLIPMTELEAVNFLLATIGELPVNSLDDITMTEGTIALDILHTVSRQIQSEGLKCNSEESYPLSPDVDGNIFLPTNTLAVDASSDGEDFVQRGGKLYNRMEHTFDFSEVDNVEVDIVFFLNFEDLPSVVRNYIAIRAARVYQSKLVGSQALHSYSQEDEMMARAAFVAQQLDVGDYNMLKKPSIQMMLRRS